MTPVTPYRCRNEQRRELVRRSKDEAGQPLWNGIDYVEVELGDPTRLRIHCIHPVIGTSSQMQVIIDGGVRITGIRALIDGVSENDLIVRTSIAGDFSAYTLRLVRSLEDASPPDGFDPRLSQIEFCFRAACASDFDCRAQAPASALLPVEPEISYLAKDYASFRRLMLDRMSVLMPSWQERTPADLQIMLVELLAYVGDQLSYYQDAVATEAYLGTARQRVSVRRHARLLDYPMHEGCNARAWVVLQVEPGAVTGGLPEKTILLTQGISGGTVVAREELDAVLSAERPAVFETMHPVKPRSSHNAIDLYAWTDEDCDLVEGATSATLKDTLDGAGERQLALAKGDFLLFEGSRSNGPLTHVVRLTSDPRRDEFDPVTGTPIVEVEWDSDDALPFALNLTNTVVRGNVVLCDHGHTIPNAPLEPATVRAHGAYRPRLGAGPLTFAAPLDVNGSAQPSARACMKWDVQQAAPSLQLSIGGQSWAAVRDLLASDPFSPELVVEMENAGTARLRFGDGVSGLEPAKGSTFSATYRVGNGAGGNVGAGTLRRIVGSWKGILSVHNPLPATGGTEPESLEQVRQFAPQAFRTQERAVTEADYAEVAQRQSGIEKAEARLRWTGSWYTAFVTVDRAGGQSVDDAFKETLSETLDRYRMAGQDVAVDGPAFVALDVALRVCVAESYFRSTVRESLLQAFSAGTLVTGARGFFHPDNFTFGQPVYLSQIYAAAMAVPGVSSVEVTRFRRLGATPSGELERGVLTAGSVEIVELANDPNRPENGKLELTMVGGR